MPHVSPIFSFCHETPRTALRQAGAFVRACLGTRSRRGVLVDVVSACVEIEFRSASLAEFSRSQWLIFHTGLGARPAARPLRQAAARGRRAAQGWEKGRVRVD